jgi:hypothetical protein
LVQFRVAEVGKKAAIFYMLVEYVQILSLGHIKASNTGKKVIKAATSGRPISCNI